MFPAQRDFSPPHFLADVSSGQIDHVSRTREAFMTSVQRVNVRVAVLQFAGFADVSHYKLSTIAADEIFFILANTDERVKTLVV